MNIAEIEVPYNSAFSGKTLKDLCIRNTAGVSIVRIIRGGININIPGGNHRIYPNDRLIIAGTESDIAQFNNMLDTSILPDTEQDTNNTKIIIDNYTITDSSPLCGKSIMNSGIREIGNCIVMGIVRPTNETLINPDPCITLLENDIIIVAGEKQKIHNFFS